MFESLGQDAQRQRLCVCEGFFARRAIGQHTGQFRDLRDPSAVRFSIDFDLQHENSIAELGVGFPCMFRFTTGRRIRSARP